jgi:TPP-dependent pyruvate/acetoin dehydrogenase alpha subunit
MRTERKLSREQLFGLLADMQLVRRFEEKVTERFRAGDLAGFLHACIGQEAVAVGVCRALAADDVIASTHRAHGHVLAKGTPAKEVMAELYGKVEGCSRGYGGSMHLYDVARGNLGANAVVGGGLPAMVGAALAFQLRKERRVAVAFFGDGATNTGAFHESLNLAQLWRVPALFVCENNRWSESTPQSQHQPIRDLTQRAAAFGMRAFQVDGQDVESVHLAALDALGIVRGGGGPAFLVCETERLTGHYIGDPQLYRDRDELRRLEATRDPIENLRTRLAVDEHEWAKLDAHAQGIVEEALAYALAGTDPDPEDALKNVYA